MSLKVLYTADIHGNKIFFEKLFRFANDREIFHIVIGGDILPTINEFDPESNIQKIFIMNFLARFLIKFYKVNGKRNLFIIPGNNDLQSSMKYFDFLEECRIVGKAIADVIKKEKKWIIIASSDFSHYIPYEAAHSTDNYVIDAILKLKERDFFLRLQERNASVCGFGPIAIAMIASKELGAKKGELLKYTTSGDVMADKGAVVGYGSIILK